MRVLIFPLLVFIALLSGCGGGNNSSVTEPTHSVSITEINFSRSVERRDITVSGLSLNKGELSIE